jgi:uroporphyrin-III C-methyltransferase/precorrin-2 dehydrogenase/sirohydrochlorin ferrochelatase
MAALQGAGIDVEVVPGVTAAHACAARIGLPVTLRQRVRQFSVVAGTTAGGEPDLDWPALASERSAFAVYMGVGNAPLLRKNLLAAGADAATPVVIVENGTLETERVVATTLGDLTDCIAKQAIAGPAVIFVGLDWEEAGLCRPAAVIVHHRHPQSSAGRPCDEVAANAEAAQ